MVFMIFNLFIIRLSGCSSANEFTESDFKYHINQGIANTISLSNEDKDKTIVVVTSEVAGLPIAIDRTSYKNTC